MTIGQFIGSQYVGTIEYKSFKIRESGSKLNNNTDDKTKVFYLESYLQKMQEKVSKDSIEFVQTEIKKIKK